jgi:hypothetical protein
MALDGDMAVIGARPPYWITQPGAAYAFERSGGRWTQVTKLVPGDSGAAAYFGNAVAIDGETIAVATSGAPNADGVATGAVYLYTRNGTTWTQRAKLVPEDAGGGSFATTVALDGGTLIVGAPAAAVGVRTRDEILARPAPVEEYRAGPFRSATRCCREW